MNRKKVLVKEYDNEATEYESLRFRTPGEILIDKLQKRIILSFIKNSKVKSLLDAATGTGRFAVELAKQRKKVFACDLSNKMLYLARMKSKKNNVRIILEKADVENLPFFDESFDAVIGIRIIMHLQNYKKGIKEMKRVVKRNGYVIFEIPNEISPWFKLNKIFRIRRMRISKFHQKYRARSFKYKEVEKILKDIGLRITETRSLFWVPETIYRITPKILTPLLEKLEIISEKLFPTKFAENIFIKAKRFN